MSQLTPLINRANMIKNDEIRLLTLKVLYSTPVETWQKPASRRHHLPDERMEWGSRLHTCRVFDCFKFIADVFEYSDITTDIGMSAALLHDCRKYGNKARSSYTLPEHPELAVDAIYAANDGIDCDVVGEIAFAVDSHMGRWTEDKHGKKRVVSFNDELKGPEARMIHLSDCIVARFAEIIGNEPMQRS